MIEEPKVTWTQEMHKYTGGMNVNAKNFQWYGSVPWFGTWISEFSNNENRQAMRKGTNLASLLP